MKKIATLFLLLIAGFFYGQSVDIYVSDAGNFNNPPWQILKYDQNGQNPVVFTKANLAWPQDILFLEDENLALISNLNTGRINKHNATTGAYQGVFASSIAAPTRMAFGPDSLIYVLQWNGIGKVLRYHRDGTYLGEFTSVGVSQSIGIAWDSDLNLYVSSFGDGTVRKFDSTGTDKGLFISTNLSGPTNIWFDTNGDLLVIDYRAKAVKRFSPSGNYLGVFISGLNNPEGIAHFSNGDFLIGNGGTGSVKMYDPAGQYIKDLVPGGSGNLIMPNAVVLRKRSTVSLDPGLSQAPGILLAQPDGGFKLNPSIISKAKSIQVLDVRGRAIGEILEEYWYPMTLAKGVYVAVVTLHDGSRLHQKILVRH